MAIARTANPALNKKTFSQPYDLATAERKMTIGGTVNRAAILLLLLVLSAGFVWAQFVRNISLALQPDITPDLVPTTFFGLSLADRAWVLLLKHARDGMVLFLTVLGAIHLLIFRRQNPLARLLRTYAVLLLMLLGPVLVVFAVGFGAQGYARFLRYVIAASPLLAGYGLWRAVDILRRRVSQLPEKPLLFTALSIVVLVSAIQIFPYQPAVPVPRHLTAGEADTPVIWLHQVNTSYQHLMLGFALENLPDDIQLVADYIGHRQSRLYFGTEAQSQVFRTLTAKPEPGFILLHWPGWPGAYMEQAEYRSPGAIGAWRTRPQVSTAYDNGGSFVLYYPDNAEQPFSLER